MNEIYITKKEIDLILEVMKENDVQGAIKLIYDSSSGIGSTLDMEFDHELHGRSVTVRTNITDSGDW